MCQHLRQAKKLNAYWKFRHHATADKRLVSMWSQDAVRPIANWDNFNLARGPASLPQIGQEPVPNPQGIALVRGCLGQKLRIFRSRPYHSQGSQQYRRNQRNS
jgi:hypothetical protein